MRRLLIVAALALATPPAALARGKFDPTTEFEQHEWIPIHLGPLNLSITKAVVYLMLGTLLTILLGISLMRVKRSGRRQALGEQIYEIAQTQVAEQGLPSKAIGRWFPYVATIMIFIWVVNLLGFIPLPLTGERWHGVPTWGIYAATSSLSVTLALALLTFPPSLGPGFLRRCNDRGAPTVTRSGKSRPALLHSSARGGVAQLVRAAES